MLRNLSESDSALSLYVRELRDAEIQKDRLKFRENLRRAGRCIAYEMSRSLPYVNTDVRTPLGTASCRVLKECPILGTVLRAGLPMHQGFLDVFDQADNAFVAAYRREGLGTSVSVALEYVGSPNLEGRVLFFCDPMLATASSMLASLKAIERHGKPRETHVAAVFASASGVEALHRARPDVHLWVGVIDPELNAKAYIVPGLGDAGDLAFGEKL